MSASVLLMFEKGEITKVRDWFDKVCPADRYPDLPVPDGGFRKDIERGVYVTFRKNIMELDRAIWDEMGGCFATLIGQELNKRFKIKKAGWDSIGYCTDAFMDSSGLLSKWYREKFEKDRDYIKKDIEFWENEVVIRERAEVFYKEEARKLVERFQ